MISLRSLPHLMNILIAINIPNLNPWCLNCPEIWQVIRHPYSGCWLYRAWNRVIRMTIWSIKILKSIVSPCRTLIWMGALLPLLKHIIEISNMPLSLDLISKWLHMCDNSRSLGRILSALSSFKCLRVCIERGGRGWISWQGIMRHQPLNRERLRWWMRKASWSMLFL